MRKSQGHGRPPGPPDRRLACACPTPIPGVVRGRGRAGDVPSGRYGPPAQLAVLAYLVRVASGVLRLGRICLATCWPIGRPTRPIESIAASACSPRAGRWSRVSTRFKEREAADGHHAQPARAVRVLGFPGPWSHGRGRCRHLPGCSDRPQVGLPASGSTAGAERQRRPTLSDSSSPRHARGGPRAS